MYSQKQETGQQKYSQQKEKKKVKLATITTTDFGYLLPTDRYSPLLQQSHVNVIPLNVCDKHTCSRLAFSFF